MNEFHCKVQFHGGEYHRDLFCVHKWELKITGGAGPPWLWAYFVVAVVSLHTTVVLSGQFFKHCFSDNSTCLLKCFF